MALLDTSRLETERLNTALSAIEGVNARMRHVETQAGRCEEAIVSLASMLESGSKATKSDIRDRLTVLGFRLPVAPEVSPDSSPGSKDADESNAPDPNSESEADSVDADSDIAEGKPKADQPDLI